MVFPVSVRIVPRGSRVKWFSRVCRAGQSRRDAPRVAERDTQRVGGVVGLREGGQFENAPGHVHDLPLVGLAVARDGNLDLRGRVLEQRDAVALRRAENHAPPVRNGDARRVVRVEEQFFDCHDIRFERV